MSDGKKDSATEGRAPADLDTIGTAGAGRPVSTTDPAGVQAPDAAVSPEAATAGAPQLKIGEHLTINDAGDLVYQSPYGRVSLLARG